MYLGSRTNHIPAVDNYLKKTNVLETTQTLLRHVQDRQIIRGPDDDDITSSFLDDDEDVDGRLNLVCFRPVEIW